MDRKQKRPSPITIGMKLNALPRDPVRSVVVEFGVQPDDVPLDVALMTRYERARRSLWAEILWQGSALVGPQMDQHSTHPIEPGAADGAHCRRNARRGRRQSHRRCYGRHCIRTAVHQPRRRKRWITYGNQANGHYASGFRATPHSLPSLNGPVYDHDRSVKKVRAEGRGGWKRNYEQTFGRGVCAGSVVGGFVHSRWAGSVTSVVWERFRSVWSN